MRAVTVSMTQRNHHRLDRWGERSTMTEQEFTALVHEVAQEEAPRLFAIVEEHGERESVRVAGYGVAFEDRAEVSAVEGGFRLSSRSAENARVLFEISSRSAGTRRAHLVWLG